MADIFISYASEDRDKARQLAAALEAQGWSIWWDRTMLPGAEFDEVIEQELNTSRCVIVLWSETSVASRWVKAEAREGLDQAKLVPVLLSEIKVPLVFRGVQGADFSNWAGEPESPAFQQLGDAVSSKIGLSPAAEAKRKSQEQETRRRAEEQEEGRRAKEEEDERQRAEAQAKKKAGLEVKQREKERERQQTEAKRKAEEERRRAGEEERKREEGRQQAEAKRKAGKEEERRKASSKEAQKSGRLLWAAVGIVGMLVALGIFWQVQQQATLPQQRAEEQRQAELEARRQIEAKAKRKAEEERHQAALEAQKLAEEERKWEEITRLLDEAAKAVEANRFIEPEGDNALYFYREVMALDPDNEDATRGINLLIARYVKLADVAIEAGRLQESEEHLRQAASVQPGADAVRLARDRMQAAIQAPMMALEGQTDDAKNKVSSLLAEAEKAIGDLRLTSPSGQNALEYYQSVLALDPSNQEAKRGLGRIVDRYVELADAAIKGDALDKANRFLDRADKVEPGAEVVQFARQRLVSAKQVASEEKRQAGGTRSGRTFRDKFEDGTEGPEMVVVPAGKYAMGANQGADDEKPPHEVEIGKPFGIGKHEVTFEEYERFVRATGRPVPNSAGWGRERRPVITVSWENAVAYGRWLSEMTGKRYRLPTEAEWEYAARAGSVSAYWWGNEVGQNRANCIGCGGHWDGGQTAPVGSFSANDFGVHDTAGNVWEWVQDCWHDSYTGAPPDGSAWEEADGGDCSRRVFRGGSWYSIPGDLRSTARYGYDLGSRSTSVGFRLAQDL